MLKIITNNWPIKLVCLLIALGLWAYVSATTVTLDKFPGGVPLELRNAPEGMIAITDVEKIQVNVVAEKNIWTKISSDSVKAFVNLSNLATGTHELPIQIDTQISGIQVVDYTPRKALVRIEPKISKSIPVNIKLEGSAGEGLVASVPVVSPDQVEISGAKSIIDKILEATGVVRLDGETNDINKKVKLIALNAENEKINGIKFNPEEVDVNVPIIKAEATKTVGIKVATNGQVASGYWISNIACTPDEVTITGKSSLLKTINYLESKPFNIDGLDKNTTRNIELNIPGGVTLVDNISQITVSLQISAISSTKQQQAKISFNNIDTNLKIDSTDPQAINVNLTADNKALENLHSDDIKLNLDLSKFHTEGSYYIDLSNTMFESPTGVSVTNFSPSSIKVNLSKK